MNRAVLVRIAATLSLVTGAGHVIGTFMAVPPGQTAMHAAIATMKATKVPMPVGAARTYMQILDGNNLCTAVLLLLAAALLFAIAGLPGAPATDRVLVVTAVALAAFAVISFLCFFPVPTVFTGVAAVLCLIARSRPHPSPRT